MASDTTPDPAADPAPPLSARDVVVLVIATIGFVFDTYELLMLPLVAPPALREMGLAPDSPEFAMWIGRLFWWPALMGGVFGLLGGYLTDLFGRRRVLTWSILVYAGATAGAAFTTTPAALLALRCATFVGVCVEFVAAVAWLAELFPEPRRREVVLGATQAISSVGGLLVSAAYLLCVRHAEQLPEILGGHSPWRYTMLTGLLPALPLILVRPLLPESPVWEQRKRAGTLRRPHLRDLFSPELRRATVVSTVLVAATYAMAYGALQQLPRIVPGLPEVVGLTAKQQQEAVSRVQLHQEAGGMTGRVLLAVFALRVVSRRTLLRLFVLPGCVIVPLVFLNAAALGLGAFQIGVFLAGVCIVAQMSFWGNYLPLVFPVHLRGTGEGFAANLGGRMFGTAAGWVTASLATSELAAQLWAPGAQRLSGTAALVALAAFLCVAAGSFLLPEPGARLRTD